MHFVCVRVVRKFVYLRSTFLVDELTWRCNNGPTS